MANEYLTRTPTSCGNRHVFTISFWTKNNVEGGHYFQQRENANSTTQFGISHRTPEDYLRVIMNDGGSVESLSDCLAGMRDFSSWQNIIVAVNTTIDLAEDRVKIYVNGVRRTDFASDSHPDNPAQNFVTSVNDTVRALIGIQRPNSSATLNSSVTAQLTDYFLIDGQALTPDVFGFYKEGKGYQSSGTTKATDFRPGQWSPHSPRKIKSDIERRGGFGVNGFYLPMNDSSNFGADFHCAPNSIIKLKGEDLPQPRNGAPTTSDAYVSQLRSDSYAANLVLAVPGISGGQDSGYGDYSADIKGSGSNRTSTRQNVSIATTAGYYGTAISTVGSSDFLYYDLDGSGANAYGTGDFTFECWFYATEEPSAWGILMKHATNGSWDNGITLCSKHNTTRKFTIYTQDGSSNVQIIGGNVWALNQWHHVVAERYNGQITLYVNGVAEATRADTRNYAVAGTPASNAQYSLSIGAQSDGSYTSNGYFQDVRVYRGVAKYKGGFDVSKPYTPVGFESWRQVPDTCKNNFATLNPLSYQTTGTYGSSVPTLSNGNLTYTHGQTGQWERSHSTMGVGEGKWYFEFEVVTRPVTGNSENWAVGLRESDSSSFYGETDGFEDLGDHVYWIDAGTAKIVSNQDRSAGSTSGITAVTNGDIINIAFEKTATALKVWFGKNGTYFNSGNPATGSNPAVNHSTTSTFIIPAVAYYQYSGQEEPVATFNFGQNPAFSGTKIAGTNADSSGKGLFKYQPPTGFLALCEDNLPTPPIADPGEHFKTVLYTGDGNEGHSITGVGFKPDLVWIKCRSHADNHTLSDTVRGPGLALYSDLNNVEHASTIRIQSFNDDGFTTGSSGDTNTSGRTFCAWCWKAVVLQ